MYLLAGVAGLGIDHHRTADFSGFARAVAGKENITATMRDVASAPAILLIGNDPTERHPLLAWNTRTNVRLNQAKLFVVNSQPIKMRRQATRFVQVPAGREGKLVAFSEQEAVEEATTQRAALLARSGLTS